MPPYLPPDTARLLPLIAASNGGRAGRVLEQLRPQARSAGEREALRALEATLCSLRGARRRAFHLAPGFRAWLAAAEEAATMLSPPRSDLALFNRVCRGAHLATLLPRGRVDRGFRSRAARLGARLAAACLEELPVHLAGFTPRGERFGPFRLSAGELPEQARIAGEIHFASPIPVSLTLPPRARLILAVPERDRSPAKRALASMAHLGAALERPAAGAVWRPREIIPGTPIVLARGIRATSRGVANGTRMRGLGGRLAAALALVETAWPWAHEEVLAHTSEVIPLDERGVVSFSMLSRPGVSYINVRGKSLIDLADDLVHETAHHRLHALEEAEGPLDEDDGEPRYVSPWRRTVRPLRGILHATYTFAYRAELLGRLLRAAGRLPLRRPPRAWLAREISKEERMLERSLGDLADAERRGLLTPAGGRLRRVLARRVRTRPG